MGTAKPYNVEGLQCIGEGGQGKVYRINADRCVKIYRKEKYCMRELAALRRGEDEPVFPRVYEWGRNYLIREYIEGSPLSDHLKTHPLTPAISRQLLDIFHLLERLRFSRLDSRLDHFLIQPDGRLRLIDPTNMIHKKEKFPRRMLAGLKTLGCRKDFFKQIAAIEPRLAESWELRDFVYHVWNLVGGLLLIR